ncbi:hypothetical protein AKJ16_DCAP05170 [Drosera capensis]
MRRMRDVVDRLTNCGDILINFVVADKGNVGPVMVTNKLYPLDYISKSNTLQECGCPLQELIPRWLNQAIVKHKFMLKLLVWQKLRLAVSEEASFSSQLPQHGGLITNKMKAADPLSLSGSSVSSPEAKRLMSLYFAFCTKRPSLLRLVLDVYGQAPKIVKQDATILIPMLSSLSKHEMGLCSYFSMITFRVLPIFPRLVDFPLDKFQKALDPILQVQRAPVFIIHALSISCGHLAHFICVFGMFSGCLPWSIPI